MKSNETMFISNICFSKIIKFTVAIILSSASFSNQPHPRYTVIALLKTSVLEMLKKKRNLLLS